MFLWLLKQAQGALVRARGVGGRQCSRDKDWNLPGEHAGTQCLHFFHKGSDGSKVEQKEPRYRPERPSSN